MKTLYCWSHSHLAQINECWIHMSCLLRFYNLHTLKPYKMIKPSVQPQNQMSKSNMNVFLILHSVFIYNGFGGKPCKLKARGHHGDAVGCVATLMAWRFWIDSELGSLSAKWSCAFSQGSLVFCHLTQTTWLTMCAQWLPWLLLTLTVIQLMLNS